MDTYILKFYLEYISIRGEEGEKPQDGAEERGRSEIYYPQEGTFPESAPYSYRKSLK